MKFIHSLQSELLKIKGSSLFWLTILGSLLIPIVFLLRFIFLHIDVNLWHSTNNVWMPLFLQVCRPFTGFLLPIGTIMICSLIAQVEYKNNNWKQVHVTPQSYTTIFFAKYTALLLLSVQVFVFLNIGVIILGVVPCLIFGDGLPKDSIPFLFFFKESLKSFICCLPIIALQYLLSLKFKNFLIAIGSGITLFIGTMMALKIELSYISPYSYALYYFDQKTISSHTQNYSIALLYFVTLTLINYFLYITKKEKG